VLVLIAVFESSQRLATAYGLAVTGTLLLTTALFLTYAATAWRWSRGRLVLVGMVLGGLELTYLAANSTKIVTGGWIPLLIAVVVVTLMTTWQRGRELITERRAEREGSLAGFVEKLDRTPITRVPGVAVFPHPTSLTAPLALRANVEFNHVLHEHVVIVSALAQNVPHVPAEEQVTVDDLGRADDGIVHLAVRFGFLDLQDIPAALARARDLSPELAVDPDAALYFLSRIAIVHGRVAGMSRWRKGLFIWLAHNAANPATAFHLPVDRTVVMGSRIEL
jgi:KUP system potassium uptake protein